VSDRHDLPNGPPSLRNSAGGRVGASTWRVLIGDQVGGVRPGEGALVWLFFIYFVILATCHAAGKSVRQATFVDTFGAEQLPLVFFLVAVVSYPVLVLYTRWAERTSHRWLIILSCAIQSAILVLFYWLFKLDERWVPVAYYVWMTITFGIAISQLWSYANHVFDPRQARRLFAIISAGGLLGLIPGGQLARLVTRWASTPYTLLTMALILPLLILLVVLIEKVRPASSRASRHRPRSEELKEARGGLSTVRSSRLLTLIAVLMLLSVLVGQAIEIQFNAAVESFTEGLDQRTEVFGSLFSIMGVLGFFFQLVFTQRIHRALGVGFGMRVLPATVLVMAVALVAALGFAPSLVITLVVVLKLSENGLRHSIDQSTRELLYLPVPAAARRRAKAFVDILVQRFAKGGAALLLLPVSLGWLAPDQVIFITVALSLTWLAVTGMARREYVGTFRSGLKTDATSEQPAIDTADVTTVTTLVHSLGSSDPRKVLSSLDLLSANGQGRLVPPVLLHHEDAEVRRRTLEVLAAENRSDAAHLVEQTIADDDPEVRTAAIRTLAVLRGRDATDMMAARLDDPDPRLRAAAVAHLTESGDQELQDRAAATFGEMLTDADPGSRAEAAKALGQIHEPAGQESLIALLYDDERAVEREAIDAVCRRLERDGPNPLYIPTLISLTGNRRLKHEAREAIVAYGATAIEALVLFMNSRDEQLEVRRAVPKTMALLGAPAADALVAALAGSDPILRAKIIDALASLSGRHQGLAVRASTVRKEVRAEAESYVRSLADLWSVSSLHQLRFEGPHANWRRGGRVPTILQQLLAQRMTTSVRNLFGLLQLLHDPDDVRAAHRSLLSGTPAHRARALEYLDNTLSGSLRRDVFAVIDDAPVEDKLSLAGQVFGITMEPAEDTIGRLLDIDPAVDPQGEALVLGAIYTVYSDHIGRHYDRVQELAGGDDPLIAETAAWVVTGLAHGHGKGRPGEKGEPMAAMARIEMMVFLQNVDLFSYCNAEEALRLAAIARESTYDAGEVIYRRNDPPETLYCVVEGRVDLDGEDHTPATVGPHGRFGVVEILSGRLRSSDAVAATDTRLLVIEAEDFFDLLSNNIDIVKALFRQLTRAGQSTDGVLQ
jgi:ATP/ADP translocase/HEAT repeat protein